MNGHSKSFSGRMYYQVGSGFMFIEREDGSIFTPIGSYKLFYR